MWKKTLLTVSFQLWQTQQAWYLVLGWADILVQAAVKSSFHCHLPRPFHATWSSSALIPIACSMGWSHLWSSVLGEELPGRPCFYFPSKVLASHDFCKQFALSPLFLLFRWRKEIAHLGQNQKCPGVYSPRYNFLPFSLSGEEEEKLMCNWDLSQPCPPYLEQLVCVQSGTQLCLTPLVTGKVLAVVWNLRGLMH